MNEDFLCVKSVGKIYKRNGREIQALYDCTVTLRKAEIVSIVGPSGCGKSTLLHVIAGFLRADSGVLTFQGEPLPPPDGSRPLVFQDDALFPWMTVAQNVAFGLLQQPSRSLSKQPLILSLVGLDNFAGRWPRELSGGMRKRVELARALAISPPLLLLDEAFTSLDYLTRREMHGLLLRLQRELCYSVINVTHDLDEAVRVSDRVLVMSARPGRISGELVIPSEERGLQAIGVRYAEHRSALERMLEASSASV